MTSVTQTNFEWINDWQRPPIDDDLEFVVTPQGYTDVFIDTAWLGGPQNIGDSSVITEFQNFHAPLFDTRCLPGFLLPRADSSLVSKGAMISLRQAVGPSLAVPTLASLSEEIEQYKNEYQDGWDGPRSKGPTELATRAALSAIARIPSGMPLPKTMLSPNGDLGLYWDMPVAYADLSFDADGQITFFARNEEGAECFADLDPGELGTNWYWSNIGSLHLTSLAA
jgi:hypothetical protein